MRAQWMEPAEIACDAEALRSEGIFCAGGTPEAVDATIARLRAERGRDEREASRSLGEGGARGEAETAREADEHNHVADEVRVFTGGKAIYDVRARDDRWIRLWVEPGDVVVVPRQRYHRFLIGPEKVTWRELYAGPLDLAPLFRGSEDSTRAV